MEDAYLRRSLSYVRVPALLVSTEYIHVPAERELTLSIDLPLERALLRSSMPSSARRPPGRSAWHPWRRRGLSPRTIHVPAAAAPRLDPRTKVAASPRRVALRAAHSDAPNNFRGRSARPRVAYRQRHGSFILESEGHCEVLDTFKGPALESYARDTRALIGLVRLDEVVGSAIADYSATGNFSRRHEARFFHKLAHALPGLLDYALQAGPAQRRALADAVAQVEAFDRHRRIACARAVTKRGRVDARTIPSPTRRLVGYHAGRRESHRRRDHRTY